MKGIILFTILVLGTTGASAQYWNQVGQFGITDSSISMHNIEINSQDQTYVAFKDDSQAGKMAVMTWDGTNWSYVGNQGVSSGEVTFVDLEISSDDTLYAAYVDVNNNYFFTVKKWNGSSWTQVGPTGPSSSSWLDLELDNFDVPYIAYSNSANSGTAAVYGLDGSSWVHLGSPVGSPDWISYLDFEFMSDNTPVLSYKEGAPNYNASVKIYDPVGASWDYMSPSSQGFSPSGVDHVSLCITPQDSIFVAFSDNSVSNKASVMKFDGSNWNFVGTQGFTSGIAGGQFLVSDPNGKLYLSFGDWDSGNAASVMTYGQGNWSYLGPAGFTPSFANPTPIALDSYNNPVAAFQDGSEQKLSVMRYCDINDSTSISGITVMSHETGGTYQWIDCDNGNTPISGATGQTFTPTSNGSYAVQITKGYCTYTSSCQTINGVGLESYEKSKIRLYPNPSNGIFTLDFGEKVNNVQIAIVSLAGKNVYQKEFNDINQLTMNPDLAVGAYFLNIIDDGSEVNTLKFLIK